MSFSALSPFAWYISATRTARTRIAYCNRVLKKIAAEVGIDKTITFHAARHTFATTNALAQGIRIEVVSRMLGHTNIKTT